MCNGWIQSLGSLLCSQISSTSACLIGQRLCEWAIYIYIPYLSLCLCWTDTISFRSPQPAATEDFGHLPPEQRRKRLQQKIDDISKELQKELDQRWAVWRTVSMVTIAMTTSRSMSTPPFPSQVYPILESIYKADSLKTVKTLTWNNVSGLAVSISFVFSFYTSSSLFISAARLWGRWKTFMRKILRWAIPLAWHHKSPRQPTTSRSSEGSLTNTRCWKTSSDNAILL